MQLPFRDGSLLARFVEAGRVLMGSDREERSGSSVVPAPFLSVFGGRSGMPHSFKPYESLTYYEDNPWLYAGVNLISQEASRVKIKLFRRKKNGEHEEVLLHQALATLNKPMPTADGKAILTHMQLKQLLFLHMKLNGEAYWLMDGRMPKKYGGGPSRLHPLLPAFVLERLNADNEIDAYLYRAAGGETVLDAMDVVHFKDPNPKNWFRGHSPVQAARFALDMHREADVLNQARLSNGANVGGLLSPKTKLSPEEQKRLQDQFNQKYGGPKNAGKTALLPTEMEYTRTQESNAEMQYAELMIQARDTILADLRIPIEMLGKTESQTRANAETSNYVFQRFTILPLVESFIDTLNNDYLPAFPGSEDLFFGFDSFVPEDLENKRANAETLSNMGGLTPNEARQGFGLDVLDIPQADVPYIPFTMTPLTTQVIEPPSDEDIAADLEGDDTDEEDELEADKERSVRAPADEGDDELPDDVGEFFDADKEKKLLAAVATPFLLQGFQQGINLANQAGGTPIDPAEVLDGTVKVKLAERSLKMAADAISTTEDQLRDLLTAARADGIGVRALAQRINDLYGESMGYRSLRIARTEMTGTMNEGAFQTYREQGYTAKTWSTILDGNERGENPKDEFSHLDADRETVPMEEPFVKSGGELMYPGDSSGEAGNVINCRCALQPGGQTEDRKAKINEQFLRMHGSLEDRFKNALVSAFKSQRGRILSDLSH